jgi:hypothetical protein
VRYVLRFPVFDGGLTTGVTGKCGMWLENHLMPNPPFGAASLKVWANARTCPVHALLLE